MLCTACQTDNLDDALFCEHCGEEFSRVCPSCAAENRPTARFCRKCRTALVADATAVAASKDGATISVQSPAAGGATRSAQQASPSRDSTSPAAETAARSGSPTGGRTTDTVLTIQRSRVPSQSAARRIREAGARIAGERKQVTVLFADLQGSMDLAEQMDPEAWSAIMQRYFDILCEGVERYEGFVDKFTGDGIMALFGAPIAHEDHAQRAGYAALHLLGALEAWATEIKREYGLAFASRIGLHSGEVVVGHVGDDLRMQYTAQGHTVGLAQRMESLASPGTCYLSAATAALAGDYFELEDLGAFRIKGLSEPQHVFRLTGSAGTRTRFDVSRARGLSRFVGRERDMQALETALAEAQSGSGQVVGVLAEAGTGKSRLCHEFAERCRARSLVVNFGRALAHGRHIPYLPMLEVFRAWFDIDERTDDRTARERIAGRLLLIDEELREALPVLFEFFGVPDPDRPAPGLDAEVKQRQIFAVLRRTIRDATSAADRLVVVIEDLHWLDAASEALVAGWVEALAGSSALLVVNFRPEYHAEWMQRPWYRQLPLAPLGAEATRELLAELLGEHPSVAALGERIQERTSGNPFYTEEVVRALAEAGDLAGTRGNYRLAVDVATIRVPPSVHGILAARIDRLAERAKRVLEAAAVLGQDFAEPLLAAVLGRSSGALSAEALRESLANLQAADFLYEVSAFPVAEYAFQHPLTREVALTSQLGERRRRLHSAAADAIEAMEPARLDTQAALLAHHREEAAEILAAIHWRMRAAREVRRRDFIAAADHVARALELARAHPELDGIARPGAELCRETLMLGIRAGIDAEAARQVFEDGMAWAARCDDELLVARLHQGISVVLGITGQFRDSLEHARLWQRVAAASDDEELRAYASWPMIAPLLYAGDLDQVEHIAAAVAAATEGHPTWGKREWALSANANALAEIARVRALRGDLAGAREFAERSLVVAREADDTEGQTVGYQRLVHAADIAGDPAAVAAPLQRMAELAERTGSAWVRAQVRVALANRLLQEGRPQEALELLEVEVEQGLRSQSVVFRAQYGPPLARALHAAGHTERALEEAEAICRIARELEFGILLADVPTVYAGILLDVGESDVASRASALLDEAEAAVRATGAVVYEPFLLMERARVAELAGDGQRQQALLAEAREKFRAMGAEARAASI